MSMNQLVPILIVGAARAVAFSQSEFITNAEETRYFAWTTPTRTPSEAFEIVFPGRSGWQDACFVEGGCTDGTGLKPEAIFDWVQNDLFESNPFEAEGDVVAVPWPAQENLDDQVGEGQYVGYSRRQVCYIAAKTLLGADTPGYANGLSRILRKQVASCGSALTGDFGTTMWKLLAACAADPTMAQSEQGPMLLVAKARERADVETVRAAAEEAPLSGANLAMCRYDDGGDGPVPARDGLLRAMPADKCSPPTSNGPGRDFMTGGPTRVKGQAIMDISAKFLGGYVFGNACGLGGGQDERLMTYFPEVFVLTMFLSQHANFPQLREPAWILGARMPMEGLDGTARFNDRLKLDRHLPMSSDLVETTIDGKTYRVSRSTPFLAFMSENQDFLKEGVMYNNPSPETANRVRQSLYESRRNQNALQRAVDKDTWFAFMYQVRAWYSAVALHSYSPAVQPALRSIATSLGTGPFLAGLWWGDSQLGFLAVWIAHAIAARTWGSSGADSMFPLEYYMYSDFTENPGNQCFVHSREACKQCLRRCEANPLPDSSYWLPHWAMMGRSQSSCVVESEDACGEVGFQDILEAHGKDSASTLWRKVESVLSAGPQLNRTVFDLLMASPVLV